MAPWNFKSLQLPTGDSRNKTRPAKVVVVANSKQKVFSWTQLVVKYTSKNFVYDYTLNWLEMLLRVLNWCIVLKVLKCQSVRVIWGRSGRTRHQSLTPFESWPYVIVKMWWKCWKFLLHRRHRTKPHLFPPPSHRPLALSVVSIAEVRTLESCVPPRPKCLR